MQILGNTIVWSASDLTAAASCEYGVLRRLDVKLHRADRVKVADDPLMARIAELGDDHELRILDELRISSEGSTRVVIELPHLNREHTAEAMLLLHERTMAAFDTQPDVVFQAGFFDGEFFGYADFIERTADGWRVCDAKLARHVRPKALLQLAAYAVQLSQAGLPVAPTAALMLGNGQVQHFSLHELIPVFEERRARLRLILAQHQSQDEPVMWGDDRFIACGSCAECSAAIAAAHDVLLVAGLRMDQRKKLMTQGVRTIQDLAHAADRPRGMGQHTFNNLRVQARLQVKQLDAGTDQDGYPNEVFFDLTPNAPDVLSALPDPCHGDIFFDFEGDPMYNEGDPELWGLEYLWGVIEAPLSQDADGEFRPLWADDSVEERHALTEFMNYVIDRRRRFPAMHIYHYAAYEKTALLRLARHFHLFEDELDELLRSGVLVDLFTTVRGAIRISQPSYSIKKLEAFYMDRRQQAAVAAGDASIAAYHEYRSSKANGDSELAAEKRKALEDYNRYDCQSTLLLRNWLLAQDAGRSSRGAAPVTAVLAPADESVPQPDPAFADLMKHSGPSVRAERTPEEQTFAMLAEAIDYYKREHAPFWWSHFDRLRLPVEQWEDERNVFIVESAEVLHDWAKAPKARKNVTRTLRLTGDWGQGSTESGEPFAVYAPPLPDGVDQPEGAVLGNRKTKSAQKDDDDERVVILEECTKEGTESPEVPVSLVPGPPPNADSIREALLEMAGAATDGHLPDRADIDILSRRSPRVRDGGKLPRTGDVVADASAALIAMKDSYLAIQGPPGTGKSWTGARIIKELVERHHWRIGVVGQSHAVVENLLTGVVAAGLDPLLVAKSKPKASAPTWTVIKDQGADRAAFLDDHEGAGCVLGGTVWTFTASSLIEPGGLDLIVIDEAGQFSLAPAIGVSIATKRLLLLGDPQQLPQVSQGTHAEPIDDSALGWLLDGHDTIPDELGYFLGKSYRMHPALCDRVSRLSYDGRLTSDEQTSARCLEGVEPGLEIVTLNHEHCRTESMEEADEVVRQVCRLIGKEWQSSASAALRPLRESDFLVVAPYNAQVNLIRQRLTVAGFGDVRVGTVDRFQGQEAPVAIVSMTASSHGDVPRGMGFLLNRNRINVAVSRAQWLAVLIRSSALTSFMPATPDGLLELGAFLALCQAARSGVRRPLTALLVS